MILLSLKFFISYSIFEKNWNTSLFKSNRGSCRLGNHYLFIQIIDFVTLIRKTLICVTIKSTKTTYFSIIDCNKSNTNELSVTCLTNCTKGPRLVIYHCCVETLPGTSLLPGNFLLTYLEPERGQLGGLNIATLELISVSPLLVISGKSFNQTL